MSLPTRQLAPDEHLVADLRPHWSVMAWPVLICTAVLAGGTAFAIDAPGMPVWAARVLVGCSCVALCWTAGRWARWTTTRYVLTTARVVFRRGVMARRGREIPLGHVADVAYHRSFLERLLRTGTVLLESAVTGGAEELRRVPRADRFCRALWQQIERSSGPARAGADVGQPQTGVQLDALDHLRRRGMISDQEFELHRAQLLQRR